MSKWTLSVVLFFLSFQIQATERLVLFGGGDYDSAAVRHFAKWAGGKNGHILIVCWGTEDPLGSFNSFAEMLKSLGVDAPASYENAEIPSPEKTQQGESQFLSQLAKATGVFFTGGDQVLVMKRVASNPAFLPAIHKSFEAGVVFAGSSAGTAIMPETMITGNGDFTVIDPNQVETISGLGLVKGFLVDQHFLKRQRQNRVFSLLLRGKERFAIGIDEGNAISIEDNNRIRVLGPGLVMAFSNKRRLDNFNVQILKPGEGLNLSTGQISR